MNFHKADTAFSKYIRLRDSKDSIATCITCREMDHFSKMTCGHYLKRRHTATRWNEENCHAQCWYCNREEERDITIMDRHARELIRLHGPRVIARLVQAKNARVKITQYDVDQIAEHYLKKIKEFEKPVMK